MEDSDSSELSDLLDTDDGEERVPPQTPVTLDAATILARKEHFREICKEIYSKVPLAPDNPLDLLMYHYYYAVQFIIVYHKYNECPVPDFVNDTDADIRQKVYIHHLRSCYHSFIESINLLGNNVLRLIRTKVSALPQGENRDTLLWFIDQLTIYTELHSRRVKSDPAASRTKTDEIQRTFNMITGEEYDHGNEDHKSWRQLIINPLPSNFDRNAINPKEGGRTHEMALLVDKMNGKSDLRDPFFVVVTTEWDKLLRILHVLLHFEDYMHIYLVGCIDLDELENMPWQKAWVHLFKEHAEVPIQKLSREKKKTPTIVSRTAELRDFILCTKTFESC